VRLDRTLPAVWVLHGADVPALAAVVSRSRVVVCDDVELLCASIVVEQSRLDESYVPTETSDLYEALGFLLGRVVEVLPRYDPTKGRRIHDPWTAGFRAWLHNELAFDLIDHWRSWFGRFGQKRMPMYLDDVDMMRRESNFGEEYDGRGGRERRSRGALTKGASDSGDVGGDALRGLLEGGDREVLREVEALGLGAAAGARGRAKRRRGELAA
jgi:hypothetical protein